MTTDLLSDTVYPLCACSTLDQFLSNGRRFPVQRAQIYGLRQIVRQEPGSVHDFATHQRERAQRKARREEVAFWELVRMLCNSTTEWSVRREGLQHLPHRLREENIPKKRQGMTHAERSDRNALRQRQREWLDKWTGDQIPAFFERFCTHALYRREVPAGSHQEANL